MLTQSKYHYFILYAVLLSSLLFAQSAIAMQDVEAKAEKVLQQMSEYLNSFEKFSFHIDNSIDVLLDSGMKIQRASSVDVSVARPNRLRADINGDMVQQELYYDGKSITLYGKKHDYFATMEAPNNIESAFDKAETNFGLVAPGSDLIFKNSSDVLLDGVISGSYIGLSSIAGVECHHLAFRGWDTDYQIWIKNSEKPLPIKLVITSRWIAGAPQFSALYSDWDISAQPDDSSFIFNKQDSADKIEFFPVNEEQ